MISKKDFMGVVIGRTIKELVFVEGIPSSPYNQILIQFDDGTYTEIYGNDMCTIGGVRHGSAKDYAKVFPGKITVIEKG